MLRLSFHQDSSEFPFGAQHHNVTILKISKPFYVLVHRRETQVVLHTLPIESIQHAKNT